jgi:hypothetical protein
LVLFYVFTVQGCVKVNTCQLYFLLSFNLRKCEGFENFERRVIVYTKLGLFSGTDDDDVIVRSFEAFEINGQIDAEM